MYKSMSYYYYYSYHAKHHPQQTPEAYVCKDGTYIRTYPPLGDSIRDMYNDASRAPNPWGVDDCARHAREIQSVVCNRIFAQDHTFEIVKNYKNNKRLGAKAMWDVGTDTGEIACAVLVPSTKTIHFAHAAGLLLKREAFSPTVMYSDTWPNKKEFWMSMVPGIEGRLGLFHFEKRILRTLRHKHIDYFDAVAGLLKALCSYCPMNYEKVLVALKTCTLSAKGKCYTDTEIGDLLGTKVFRDRYSKYLRKSLHPPQTIVHNLDAWFCRYKVTASIGSRPAEGRFDPFRQCPLFTPETKDAVTKCKEKAEFLSDPFPLDDMYDEIHPNPNSRHNLIEYLSRRGESKLEAFHDRASHFGNSGMRDSLADSLNLCGTARFNLTIRHKRSLIGSRNEKPVSAEERRRMPAAWEVIVPYDNHSELQYINQLAKQAGATTIPFPKAETLPPDNGERFFFRILDSMSSQSAKIQ